MLNLVQPLWIMSNRYNECPMSDVYYIQQIT